MTLRLDTLPLSTNNLYAHSGRNRFMTQRGKRNKEMIAWEARAQYRGKPLTEPLKVTIDLYWPTRANHDIDNLKVLLDALTGIIYEDDGQIEDLHTRKFYDKADPRVELTIVTA